jgi:hypothetical protein
MIIILKTSEYLELQKQLAAALAQAKAGEAEIKVLRELNQRLDDEAKRAMNMLTRGLAGYDFWNDPAKEAERAANIEKETQDAQPTVPVSGRDWSRVGQQIEDEQERQLTLLRRKNQIAEITNPPEKTNAS